MRASRRSATPAWRARSANQSDSAGGSTRSSRRGALSSTVTAAPKARAVEATSRPRKPPPITTTRACGVRPARSAAASSSVLM
ncbi:hypothetical protein G6F57_015748 [Rhizopus arrhizus]|nr:hypothetical protein G6F57_015748 [Rhizopus arrhizus]